MRLCLILLAIMFPAILLDGAPKKKTDYKSVFQKSFSEFTLEESEQLYLLLGKSFSKTLLKTKKPKSLDSARIYASQSTEETLTILQPATTPKPHTKILAEQKICSDIARLLHEKRYPDAKKLLVQAARTYEPISRFLITEDTLTTRWPSTYEQPSKPLLTGYILPKKPVKDITSLVHATINDRLYIGYKDGSILCAKKTTNPEIIGIKKSPIQKLFLNEQKEVLLSINTAGTLNIWHIPTGEKISTHDLQTQPQSSTITPDKTTLKIVDQENKTRAWKLQPLSRQEALFFKSCQIALSKPYKKQLEIPANSGLRELLTHILPLISKTKQKHLAPLTKCQPNNPPLSTINITMLENG